MKNKTIKRSRAFEGMTYISIAILTALGTLPSIALAENTGEIKKNTDEVEKILVVGAGVKAPLFAA